MAVHGVENMAARYWLGTIAADCGWKPPTELPESCVWIRGQLEIGAGGFQHWQVFAAFSRPHRFTAVKVLLVCLTGHWEPSRSKCAEEYVWKEETRVAGSQFELGGKAVKRNSKSDWEAVLRSAKSGNHDEIPPDIFVRCYHQIRSISAEYSVAHPIERSCYVYWGKTGTGKSRKAWDEAGFDAYCKDPRTKWWCGYRGEKNVIIDEFRGTIDVSHLLRWLDRYPVRVETKGSSKPLSAVKIWITSNLSPDDWYPEIDEETKLALRRRLNITHFN